MSLWGGGGKNIPRHSAISMTAFPMELPVNLPYTNGSEKSMMAAFKLQV